MALKVADRVKQLTTSTGTGDISFSATPTGFISFSSVLTNGDTTYYCIEENDKWEVGVGIYGSDNMVRSYILASSNGGNAINLGGSGTVFITYPAGRSVYQDEESQTVIGSSGIVFSNGTVVKEAKITELTDVDSSGTILSGNLLSFDSTHQGLLIGDRTGPSNDNNTLIGYGAASGTTGTDNTVLGTNAFTAGNGGIQSVSIGSFAGPSEPSFSSSSSYSVSIGYKAGSRMRSNSTAIGYQAGIAAYEEGFVAIGASAGSGIGSFSVAVGKDAANGSTSNYIVAVGHQAGKDAGGDNSVWIGDMAGLSCSSSSKSVGIGYQAGKNSSGSNSIYIGKDAGHSSTETNYLYIGNGTPSSSRTLIKGDMQSKRLAIGAADVTLEDTLYVGIASSVDTGLVVRGAASQTANLQEWQDFAGGIQAKIASSGILGANGVHVSGQGLTIDSSVPTNTTNALYSIGGTLYWNLSPVGVPTGVPTEVSFYDGLGRLVSDPDFVFDSGSLVLTAGSTSIGDRVAINESSSRVRVGRYVGDDGITDSNFVSAFGYQTATNASGANNSFIAGYYTAYNSIDLSYSQVIGSFAGLFASGEKNTYVGEYAGAYSSGTYNTFIGHQAGRYCKGSQNIEILASGAVNSVIDNHSNKLHIGNTIIGDTSNKKLAIGNVSASNVTPDATLEILPKNSTDIGVIVQGAVSQSANLQEWQASNAVPVVQVSAEGNLSASGSISASGAFLIDPLVPSVTTNKLYNDGGTLKFNGSVVGADDDTYISGVATYSSGVLNGGIPTFDDVNVKQYIYHDGDANTFIRLRADQIDFNAGGLNFLSLDEGSNDKVIVNTGGNDIDFQVEGKNDLNLIRTDAENDLVGIGTSEPAYKLDVFGHDAWIRGTGLIVGASGIVFSDGSTQTTAGASDTYASGIAAYASGQAISNQSSISTNASNISTNTGNISNNTSNISTNTANISKNVDSINYVSGISVYTSGQLYNDSYVSGVAVYASGQAISNQSNVSTNTSNISTNTSNISTNTSRVAYASGQAIENETDISYVSGIAVYASGNSGGGGGDVTTAQLNYVSGIAVYGSGVGAYASGQAIENEAAIATNVSNISTNTSNISTNTGRVNYASGLAITNELNVAYASGQAIENETAIATNTSNISTNTSNISTNSGRITYASGQAIQNEIDIAYVSGAAVYASGSVHDHDYVSGVAAYASGNTITTQAIANYASGQAIENEGLVTYASGNTANISFGSNAEGDMLFHNGTTFVRLAKGADDYILKMNGNQPNWEEDTGGGGGDVTTAQLNYVSGIAVYSSGIVSDVDVIIGQQSTTAGTGIAIGYGAGLDSSLDNTSVANGYQASDVLIGHFAGSGYIHKTPGIAFSSVQLNTMIGYKAGANSIDYLSGTTSLGHNVFVGHQAGHSASGYQNTFIGESAGYQGSGIRNIGLGHDARKRSSGEDNIAIGSNAGYDHYGNHCVYIGYLAGDESVGNNNIEIVTDGSSPSSIGSNSNKLNIEHTIIGDTSAKKLAIGNVTSSDLTPDATLEIKPKVATDIGAIVQGAAAHSASLQEWQSSSEIAVATISPDGSIASSGTISASGGILLDNIVPSVTTNKLYNEGGTLKFNGSAVGGGGGGDVTTAQLVYVSGIAVHGSGDAVYSSGIAAYASGQAIQNETDIAYTSGIATYASGNTIATQNIAEYASGSAAYASGQLISTQSVDFTAGDGLTGGGTLASDRTFAVGAGNLIDVQADQVDVDLTEAAAATIAHGDNLIFLDGGAAGAASKGSTDDLAALLAGDGLTKSNSVMAVNVDDSTIETNSDAIRVKDNGITLAKMAGLARGKIIYGDSNGDPAALALGGANQVLTSDGTDVTWADNVNTYLSGVAAYSSGNTIVNDGLVAYASGNTANIAFGSNAEGDILIHDGSKFTRLARGTDNYILKMNGNLPNWEAESGGSSLTAGSGITIDGADRINVHGGSGHFINLDVEGAFTATTKSFLIDHPSKQGMKLQYASLEGPENGVYVRGTTDQGFITLPDYWRDLVDNNSITVTLTPVGQFQPIFVEQKNNREIRVGGVCGYYDYVVWGERKDVDKLEVEW